METLDFTIEGAEKRGRKKGRQEGLQEGLQEGRQEGLQEGLQEGRQEGLQEVALKLLHTDNMSIEKISQITGLSKQEILKLRKKAGL